MTNGTQILKGVVRGKTVELEQDSGLPDGQAVSIRLTPTPTKAEAAEGLCRSFGAWADVDPAEFEAFLQQNRKDRKASRPEIEP